jgi:hypothetical protein
MTAPRRFRESLARRALALAVPAVLALSCGGGDPAADAGTDAHATRLDVAYGGNDVAAWPGTDAEETPAPDAKDPGTAAPDEAPCTGDDCGTGDVGTAPADAAADGAQCSDPVDWRCVDAATAQRCTDGRMEFRDCGADATCNQGLCFPNCPEGTANCTKDPAAGCTVTLATDPHHCGNCYTDCGAGACLASKCVCASVSQAASRTPLDMFIMMDQSGSMDDPTGTSLTKWEAVTQALSAFLQDPASAGISVGIQYFPLPTGALADDSCKVADYAKPEVAIDVLPGHAQAVITSMGKHGPSGGTPTYPALKGAVTYASTWAASHLDHVVVVVFATDGDPTSCSPLDISSIAHVAATATIGKPPVKTFVVGVGDLLSGLDPIAAAGGTTKAWLVDQGGNVVQQFAAALQAIQGQALGCSYQVPTATGGATVDFQKVNVRVTLTGGAPAQLAYVEPASACTAAGGWYYDDPAAPGSILLCPATCDDVTGDSKAQVEILLGCQRTTEPPDTHR